MCQQFTQKSGGKPRKKFRSPVYSSQPQHSRKPVVFNLGLKGHCAGVGVGEGTENSSLLSVSHVNSP